MGTPNDADWENQFWKFIFGITVTKPDDSQFIFLPRLVSQLQSVAQLCANLGGPAGTPEQPGIDPRFMIPCEICERLFPMELIEQHQESCPGGNAVSTPATGPSSYLLARNILDAAVDERLQQLYDKVAGVKYLMQCYDRCDKWAAGKLKPPGAARPTNDALSQDLLKTAKSKIIALTKRLLQDEVRRITNPNASEDLFSDYGAASPAQQATRMARNQQQLLALLETVPGDFLSQLTDACNEAELETIFKTVFQGLGWQMMFEQGKNMLLGGPDGFIKKLKLLLGFPSLSKLFYSLLAKEAQSAMSRTAREMQETSVLGPFLSCSPIYTVTNPPLPLPYKYFTPADLPNYPTCTVEELRMYQDNLRIQLKQINDNMQSIIKQLCVAGAPSKEAALQWMASILTLNEMRAHMFPGDELAYELALMNSSDGFLLNLANILLLFCGPFMDPNSGKLNMINPAFCTSTHRLDLLKQPKLTDNTHIAGPTNLASRPTTPKTETNNAGAAFSFISEIFFLTFHSLHVGVVPCANNYANFLTVYSQMKGTMDGLKAEQAAGVPAGVDINNLQKRMNTVLELIDSYEAHLLDPNLINNAAAFCHLALSWLAALACGAVNPSQASPQKPGQPQSPQQVKPAAIQLSGANATPQQMTHFTTFPEYFVKDIADLLVFLIIHKPITLDNIPLANTVDAILVILSNPAIIKSPLVRAKLCNVLCEMHHTPPLPAQGNSWGVSPISLQQRLWTILMDSQIAQAHTAAALMSVYIDVEIVEGLDVDKEKFDKYSVRRNIASLMSKLWEVPVFKKSIRKEIEGGALSGKFISTTLNDCIHLLDDSLGRLIDIKQLQQSMQDKVAWMAQTPQKRSEREAYYRGQERSARAFMTLASAVLDLLNSMAVDVPSAFISTPVIADKTASMLNHFFDMLCGPGSTNLKVENPEKYGFQPKVLLMKIAQICISLGNDQRFVTAMGSDLDYSPQVMGKALFILTREAIVGPNQQKKLEEMIASIEKFQQQNNKGQKQETSQPMEVDGGVLSSALDGPEHSEQEYVDSLKTMVFDACSMLVEGEESYDHHYNSTIITSANTNPKKMVRLQQECEMLMKSLPVSVGSSIFVRCDEDRLDIMKAIITGPRGTPYANGCFMFDIFFPSTYPDDPPLVNLETTGNGTVRFNPNLYNCGKVCLSLLGTWHGEKETKWSPASNILQVLLSIQGLILVEQPYFNEPSYEAQRGTQEGAMRSQQYNTSLSYNTLRHAMLAPLKNPYPGFKDVITEHFRMGKHRILRDCEAWVKEAKNTTLYSKFLKAFTELKQELAKL